MPVWRRVTTRPVTIGGVDLPKGAKLFLWLAAGAGAGRCSPNRPASTWTGLTPASTSRSGWACTTASAPTSAAWKPRLALEELARRYPRLRLAGDQEFTFHPNISFRRTASAADRRRTLTARHRR